jgi:hypothetical protein
VLRAFAGRFQDIGTTDPEAKLAALFADEGLDFSRYRARFQDAWRAVEAERRSTPDILLE